MDDAAVIIDLPDTRDSFAEFLATVSRRRGYYQWYSADTIDYVWRDADLVKIAAAGLIPMEVSLTILAVHIPDMVSRIDAAFGNQGFQLTGETRDEAQRERNVLLTDWDTRISRVGVLDQPDLSPQLATFTDWVTETKRERRQRSRIDPLTDAPVDPLAPLPLMSGPASRPGIGGRYQDYRRNQELYGNMEGRRQRASAITRAEQEELTRQEQLSKMFQINWYANVWSTPATDGSGGIWHYRMSDMQDQHLWDTLIWLIRQVTALYTLYVPHANRHVSVGLGAKTWLVQQPIFRSLLAEAIKRKLTFPQDVFRFLRQYALTRDDTVVQVTKPWKDPQAGYQIGLLDDFLHQEIQAEMGKDLRRIDIEE